MDQKKKKKKKKEIDFSTPATRCQIFPNRCSFKTLKHFHLKNPI